MATVALSVEKCAELAVFAKGVDINLPFSHPLSLCLFLYMSPCRSLISLLMETGSSLSEQE